MKRLSVTTLFLWLLSPLTAASISSIPIALTDDSSPLRVFVTLDDAITSGGVTFTIEVSPDASLPNTADLRGFFFNADPLINPLLDIDDIAISSIVTSTGTNTKSLGGGNNVNGGSPALGLFDFAVEIGGSGIGGDDIQSASFFFPNATLGHFSEQAFAVRATSVGPGLSEGDRGGSSKLSGVFPEFDPDGNPGDDPDTSVPEPSSIGLMGLGLLSLGWIARRQRRQR